MKFKKTKNLNEIKNILDALSVQGKYEDEEFLFEIKVKPQDQLEGLSYKNCKPVTISNNQGGQYALATESNPGEICGTVSLTDIEFISLGKMTAGQEVAAQRKRITMICPVGNHEYTGLSTSVGCTEHAKRIKQRRWRAKKKESEDQAKQ